MGVMTTGGMNVGGDDNNNGNHNNNNDEVVCTSKNKCDECEPHDCNNDSQCATGLLCADSHHAQLKSIGSNHHKAYCGANVGASESDLCFNPNKLLKKCTKDDKCDACEARDCDSDDQCSKGLKCAYKHTKELINAGLDSQKAYCDDNIGFDNWDLCYDPKALK
jgi:hypothetical protein